MGIYSLVNMITGEILMDSHSFTEEQRFDICLGFQLCRPDQDIRWIFLPL